jgi:hypothetical protein
MVDTTASTLSQKIYVNRVLTGVFLLRLSKMCRKQRADPSRYITTSQSIPSSTSFIQLSRNSSCSRFRSLSRTHSTRNPATSLSSTPSMPPPSFSQPVNRASFEPQGNLTHKLGYSQYPVTNKLEDIRQTCAGLRIASMQMTIYRHALLRTLL